MEEKNYLEKAKEIKEWVEKSEQKLLPSKKSKNEEEKRLAKEYKFITKKIINPYQKLKKEEDIKAFEEKYPNIYEITEIIQSIEKESIEQNISKAQEDIMNGKEQEVNAELEQIEEIKKHDFDYDKDSKKQVDLVKLISKDLKISKQIEKANKLKQKYEK